MTGYLEPAFLTKHADGILPLWHDIGMETSNVHFPKTRHKDWWTGHSWATGLFSTATGKGQESSSEAVHAYYAMTLLARSMQVDETFPSLLLAMEMRSVQTYWHMDISAPVQDWVYEPTFVLPNRMVGVVAETKVSVSTWFGNEKAFVHGIQLIPFTAVTAQLFPITYVQQQLPILESAVTSRGKQDIWSTIATMEAAMLDPETSWKKFMECTTGPCWDTGLSKAGALYWTGTRPRTKAKDVSDSPTIVELKANCLGFPSCFPLQCCGTFPGCCNRMTFSNLECCPNFKPPPSLPTPVKLPDSSSTCHNQPQCAVAGANHTALACCSTKEGCCPGLGCCTPTPSKSLERPTFHEKTQPKAKSHKEEMQPKSNSQTPSSKNVWFALGISVFLFFSTPQILFFIRRRTYEPLERNRWQRIGECSMLVIGCATVAIFYLFFN